MKTRRMIGLALAALWVLLGLLWRKWGRSDDKVRETLQEARRRVRSAGLGEIHFNGQPMLKPGELAKDATHCLSRMIVIRQPTKGILK